MDSVTEGELARWEKKVGDFVRQDELIATLETDKVDVAINAPENGTILELLAKEGDSVTVGQDLFKLDSDGKDTSSGVTKKEEAPKAEEPKKEAPKPQAEPKSEPKKAPVSAPAPSKSAPAPNPASSPKSSPKPTPPATHSSGAADGVTAGLAPLPADYRTERRVKMNRMRLRISERLKESQNTAASLTTFNEIDMSNLMEFRSKYKDDILKQHGIKLGFMSAFAKASVAALQAIPAVNASIEEDDEGNAYSVYKDYCDISIAVATPKGLVTPVLRNVEKLSFVEIEKAIAEYGAKARENKISIEDMAGGTFTISNGGVFGSMFGTPIINLPQSAILGMHAVKDRAVVVNGKVKLLSITLFNMSRLKFVRSCTWH